MKISNISGVGCKGVTPPFILKNKLISLLAASAIFAGGCSYPIYSREISRNLGDVNYKETISIKTEPQNARIYNGESFIGTSPLVVTLNAQLEIKQMGEDSWQERCGIVEIFPPSCSLYKRFPREWNESTGKIKKPYFKFRAFKEGYATGVKKLNLNRGNKSIQRVLNSLDLKKGKDIPKTIYGKRNMLIVLDALELAQQKKEKRRIARNCANAKREYNNANEAYKNALKGYENSKTEQSMNEFSEGMWSGLARKKGTRQANSIYGLSTMLSETSKQITYFSETEVAIAKEKVDVARARLSELECSIK